MTSAMVRSPSSFVLLPQRCSGCSALLAAAWIAIGILSRRFAASVLQSRKACCACRGFQRATTHAAYTQRGHKCCRPKKTKYSANYINRKQKRNQGTYIETWVPGLCECFGLFKFFRLPATGLPSAMNHAKAIELCRPLCCCCCCVHWRKNVFSSGLKIPI